ncbi:PaaI family thioesterase [Nocardia sp. CA2R105]|uniref:PaaI family thioesterase n=1 Tax=Nocardia coffeae TaxID=2873381 RepID=UPI001CA6E36E|nr:PaaI family thioesterase [Nocardia coffeae]MBY8858649.1 PaaI family thioesterase [Nocardia coffeae]
MNDSEGLAMPPETLRKPTTDELIARLGDLQGYLADTGLGAVLRTMVDDRLRAIEGLLRIGVGTSAADGADLTATSRSDFLPDHVVDGLDAESVRGRVTFADFYHGSLGVVHGGATALLFDHVLGLVSLGGGRDETRTAYLHVDYRAMAPLGEELTFSGGIDRVDGRKVFLAGELCRGDVVVAQAQALFVTLHPDVGATTRGSD